MYVFTWLSQQLPSRCLYISKRALRRRLISHQSRTLPIVDLRTDKRRRRLILIRQPDQRILGRIIARPPKLLTQTALRIVRERRPSLHHIGRDRVLRGRVGDSRDVGRRAVHDADLGAVVGGRIRVEAQIRPVAEVAISPDGDTVRGAGGCRGAGGAGEGFEVEEVDLGGGEGVVGGEDGDGVVAVFVVVVSREVGEGCEGAG